MEGQGQVIGKKAPDFVLPDHLGGTVKLQEAVKVAPVLLAFYPGDFTPVCTKQLCNYGENIEEFNKFGIQIFGVSRNTPQEHAEFAEKFKFPFLLLTDRDHAVAKQYGCTSLMMLGMVSRAVFIVNTKGFILYRYVEPTTFSHRKAGELLGILKDLRNIKAL